MKDIAEAAGVSRTTVSFVLNDSPKAKLISEETRMKVLAVAKELGYRPNLLARSVATGKTKIIGIIANFPGAVFESKMFAGLLKGLEEYGYLLKFIGLDSEQPAGHFVDVALEHRLAGIITLGYPPAKIEALHAELAEHQIPYCVLARSFPVTTGIRVISDDIQGGLIAVDHLVEYGHKRIVFIGHDAGATSVLREQGYLAGMAKHGLEPIIPKLPDLKIETLKRFWTDNPDITAAFATSPHRAATTIKAARKVGRKVPEDLSVVGYAQTELTDGFDPKITTISQHHQRMGETAATELVNAIESGTTDIFKTATNHLIPVALVPGESVACVQK